MILKPRTLRAKTLFKAKDYEHDAYSITAGGNYNFGVATLSGIYQYAWSDDVYKQHAFGISGAIPAFGGTAKLGGKMIFGKDESKAAGEEDKYRGWSLNAAYQYRSANAPLLMAMLVTHTAANSGRPLRKRMQTWSIMDMLLVSA